MKRTILLLIFALLPLYGSQLGYDNQTRGLVRHLLVHKYPKWAAKIELANGKELYFCSPKSMFEFYWRPGKWYDLGVRSEADFKKLLVTDYQSGKPIDARGAFFVYGSRVTSPAGDDLVPLASYEAAQKFIQKNGGSRILNFSQVNYALINLLNGRI